MVESVAFSQNGRLLAAGSTDGTVQLWDTADPRRPKVLATLQTTEGAQAFSVAFSRDGLTLAVASADRTVWLWVLANPGQPTRLREPLSGPTSYLYHVIFQSGRPDVSRRERRRRSTAVGHEQPTPPPATGQAVDRP